MKSVLKWLLLALLMAGITGFGFYDGTRLPWPPEVGTYAKYEVVNVLTTPFGSKVTFAWTTTRTVKSIDHGEVTFKAESSETVEKADGPTGCPVKLSGPNGDIVFGANGAYLPSQEDNGSLAARFGNLTASVFPEKPVTVGESWQHKIKGDTKAGTWSAQSTYKFLGKEKITNWDAYKIAVDYRETEGDKWERLSATGTRWIAVEDGMLVQEKLQVNAPYGVEKLNIDIESKRAK